MPDTLCEVNHSCRGQAAACCGGAQNFRRMRVRSMTRTSYDVAANRFLLIGCIGVVALIATLLIAALR